MAGIDPLPPVNGSFRVRLTANATRRFVPQFSLIDVTVFFAHGIDREKLSTVGLTVSILQLEYLEPQFLLFRPSDKCLFFARVSKPVHDFVKVLVKLS